MPGSQACKPFEDRESKRAVALIEQHGVYGLGSDPEGCACTEFAVCGFAVNVSCHKSRGVIEVSARHCDITQAGAVAVAKAVVRSMAKELRDGRDYLEILAVNVEAGVDKREMEAVELL